MPRPRPSRPLDFAGVIALWPSVTAFCADTGVPDATVRAWLRRGRIPPDHWDTIVTASARAQIPGLSIDVLMAALRIAMAREEDDRLHREAAAAAKHRTAPKLPGRSP